MHREIQYPVNAKILLSASVSISLLSISFIHKTIQIPEQYRKIHKLPGRTIFFAALLVLIPGLFEMNTILFLSITIIIILAPIFFGVRLWVKEQVSGIKLCVIAYSQSGPNFPTKTCKNMKSSVINRFKPLK